MTAVIGKILGAILRSLFVSIVMFIIVFSVISGEFPPNFERLAKTYQSLKQMNKISRQVHAPKKTHINQNILQDDLFERDIEALENLNQKRAELGENILTGGGLNIVPKQKNKRAQSTEDRDLRGRIVELQSQVYRLQQRVSQLEDKVK